MRRVVEIWSPAIGAVGTATAPTGITLVCEELGVRDDITETQLLAGTFGDLAEWLRNLST